MWNRIRLISHFFYANLKAHICANDCGGVKLRDLGWFDFV